MAKSVTAAHIDERLNELPELSFVAIRDDARLAVSPAGIFVVLGDVGGVSGAAEGAFELARATRASLSDMVMPTPIVESVVVSRKSHNQTLESLVVFVYHLDKLIGAGQQLDENTVERVYDAVSSGLLAPGWSLRDNTLLAAA